MSASEVTIPGRVVGNMEAISAAIWPCNWLLGEVGRKRSVFDRGSEAPGVSSDVTL